MNRIRRFAVHRLWKVPLYIIAAVILLADSGLLFGDEADTEASIRAFEAFQTIIDRNIFNPRRRPVEVAAFSVATPTPEKIIRTERLFLTGALIHDGTAVAFFEGSRDNYEGAVPLHGTIAGFRIARILTDRIQIEQNGNLIDLFVGSGLSRPEGGEWKKDSGFSRISEDRPRVSIATDVASATSGESGAAVDTTGSPSAGGLLERLMERRRQELGQ